MTIQWAPAIKTSLGDTYHWIREGGVAMCNPRWRLDVKHIEVDASKCNACGNCLRMVGFGLLREARLADRANAEEHP